MAFAGGCDGDVDGRALVESDAEELEDWVMEDDIAKTHVDFAAQQSRQDRQNAVEYMKSSLQLLIGGGTFLSAGFFALMAGLKDLRLAGHLALPLGLSLFAIVLGMASTTTMFLAKQNFGHHWEGRALGYSKKDIDTRLKWGVFYQRCGVYLIWIGFVVFGASAYLAFDALRHAAG